MSAVSSRKRKLDDNYEPVSTGNIANSVDSPSPRKKAKLDDKINDKTDAKATENADIAPHDTSASFQIQLGSEPIIRLFASNAINDIRITENVEHSNNELSSLTIGRSDWNLQFYQLPTDPKHDIYQFLDGLFGDKLCDWKEYINKDNHNESHKSSNNFVTVIKDGLGVWRGAILFIVYQIHAVCNEQDDQLKYLIKIPLAGVDLHFRRQNVGSILVHYTVSMIHKVMGNASRKYEIIVLVIDDTQAKSFWTKNKFIRATEYKQQRYPKMFDRELMIKKGFVLDVETELIIMIYTGDKTTDLVLNNAIVDAFENPKYVNFGQRYCKKHEIEQHEKDMKEWQQKKKELEEKMKHKKE
eukprot:356859_1